jgi:hypothetical protein
VRRGDLRLNEAASRPAKRLTGVGVGLRWTFIDEVVAAASADEPGLAVDFFEISPENYMRRGGYVHGALAAVAERWPILTHGLTMSMGGLDPVDDDYVRELRALLDRLSPPFHSDHLCFGGHGGRLVHDLLPLPFIEESVENVAARASELRERLGVPLAAENISYYFVPGAPEMTETAFLRAVLEEADLGLLLDVNNVFVNAQNFGFDPRAFLAELPVERVVAIHVAGHEFKPEHGRIIDTHGADAPAGVLDLLEQVVARTGPVPVVLERDSHIPDLPVLMEEVGRVRAAYTRGLAARAA